jgi:hypothetical protein
LISGLVALTGVTCADIVPDIPFHVRPVSHPGQAVMGLLGAEVATNRGVMGFMQQGIPQGSWHVEAMLSLGCVVEQLICVHCKGESMLGCGNACQEFLVSGVGCS